MVYFMSNTLRNNTMFKITFWLSSLVWKPLWVVRTKKVAHTQEHWEGPALLVHAAHPLEELVKIPFNISTHKSENVWQISFGWNIYIHTGDWPVESNNSACVVFKCLIKVPATREIYYSYQHISTFTTLSLCFPCPQKATGSYGQEKRNLVSWLSTSFSLLQLRCDSKQ